MFNKHLYQYLFIKNFQTLSKNKEFVSELTKITQLFKNQQLVLNKKIGFSSNSCGCKQALQG
jgi:hypothetical protein